MQTLALLPHAGDAAAARALVSLATAFSVARHAGHISLGGCTLFTKAANPPPNHAGATHLQGTASAQCKATKEATAALVTVRQHTFSLPPCLGNLG